MAWTKDEKEMIKAQEERIDKLRDEVRVLQLNHEQKIQDTRREHEGEIKVLKAEVAILKHFLFAIILAVIGAAIVAALSLKK
jgi:3-dehydroquinate dehydratase